MTRSAGVVGALTSAPQCWLPRRWTGLGGRAPAHPATPGNGVSWCSVDDGRSVAEEPVAPGPGAGHGTVRPRARRPGPTGDAGPRVRPWGPGAPGAVRGHAARCGGARRAPQGRHESTIMLVAADGEWTRRRIDGPDVARRLSRQLAVPVYDAPGTGYPQRVRDWNSRQEKNRLR